MKTWTEDKVELLLKLNEEGHRSRYIGEKLGVTRNAVIGKLNRLGKSKKAKDQSDQATTEEEAPSEKEVPVQDPARPLESPAESSEAIDQESDDGNDQAAEINDDEEAITDFESARDIAAETEKKALRLSLEELTEQTCKWPVGDPATEDFWFCGLPSKPGKPYCQAHIDVAIQPLASRRDPRSNRKFPGPRPFS